jgi:hypothetical protein
MALGVVIIRGASAFENLRSRGSYDTAALAPAWNREARRSMRAAA